MSIDVTAADCEVPAEVLDTDVEPAADTAAADWDVGDSEVGDAVTVTVGPGVVIVTVVEGVVFAEQPTSADAAHHAATVATMIRRNS